MIADFSFYIFLNLTCSYNKLKLSSTILLSIFLRYRLKKLHLIEHVIIRKYCTSVEILYDNLSYLMKLVELLRSSLILWDAISEVLFYISEIYLARGKYDGNLLSVYYINELRKTCFYRTILEEWNDLVPTTRSTKLRYKTLYLINWDKSPPI